MDLDKIPSFITSSNYSILINFTNDNELINIKNILKKYYDDYIFDFKSTQNTVEITKKGKYLRSNKYISRLSSIGFQHDFVKTKVFEPIIVNAPNKIILSINFGILIKSMINNLNIEFDNDMSFSSLKKIFPLLRGRDEYIIKKKDLEALLLYSKKLDTDKFIPSERIRCGTLVGITNFRIGDCLYDIKYKNKVTSKEFFKSYIYATILNEMGIKINKIIILSTRLGIEYTMNVNYNIMIDSTLSFYKKEKTNNLDFIAYN